MTTENLLIAAMLVQGLIPLLLLALLGYERLPLIARGKVKIRDIALDDSNWPKRAVQLSNAVNNQFQLPLLFYVACALSLYFTATWWALALAWAFVVTRLAHAYIFATTNHVPTRFMAYTAGLVILVLFWLALIVQLVIRMIGQ